MKIIKKIKRYDFKEKINKINKQKEKCTKRYI